MTRPGPPVDEHRAGWVLPARLRGMSTDPGAITVPPEQLYDLAESLRAQGEAATELAARFAGTAPVGGPLQAAVDGFLECHRSAAGAVAGELRWLGGTIAAVADSWLALDASLLAPPGEARAR